MTLSVETVPGAPLLRTEMLTPKMSLWWILVLNDDKKPPPTLQELSTERFASEKSNWQDCHRQCV